MIRDRLLRLVVLGSLLTALAVWHGAATAQVYNTRVYGPSDGLNSSVVFGAAQDSTGRLWFATRRGLVRYDGKDWQSYPDPASGFERGTRDVCIDAGGRLWSTTALGGVQIACHDLDGSVRYSLPPVGGAMLARGTLFLTVAADGVAPDRVLLANLNGTVSYWNGDQWRTWGYGDPATTPDLPTAAVAAESCFLLASQSGLWCLPFSGKPSVLDLPGLPPGPVYGICRAGDGGFWLAGRTWLGRLKNDRVTLVADDLDLDLGPLKYEIAAAEGPSGGLYFGGFTTAYHFHPERGLEKLGRASGLIGGGCTDILVDRENLVWICSARGVSKLIDRSVASMDRRHGLYEDEVSAVNELSPGRMIFGHNGGLTVLGEETLQIPLPTDQLHARVMDIHVTEQGPTWLACDVGGLARWSEEKGFRWYGATSGVRGTIYTVTSDKAGTLWVGGNRGLVRRDGEVFRAVPLFSDPQKKTDYVRRLEIARDGTLLAATGNNGLLRGDEAGFTRYAHPDNELLNSAYAAYEDSSGRVFVGTSGGLCRVEGDRLVRSAAPDPVINVPVYAILEDARGNLWFGTDRGVMRWTDGNAFWLTQRQGLLGSEVNRAAVFSDSRGVVWVGTDAGVTFFDLFFLPQRPNRPKLEISGIEIDGITQPFTDDYDLGAGARDVVLHFAAPSFVDEERLMFRMKLEGLDDSWRPPTQSPQRLVRYLSVPPGDYRFLLQAVRSDSVASEIVRSPLLTIQPHLVSRLWFQILVVVITLLLVVSAITAVTGRRYARRLRAEVQARTQDLALSEDRLRTESERLGAVLRNISDGVLTLDNNLRISLMNPACARIIGRPDQHWLGAPLAEILPSAVDWLHDALHLGRSGATGIVTLLRDGNQLTLEMAASELIAPDGRVSGTVLVFRDVTERRQAELERERSQRLESLGVLAGGIAHDFNNLLTVILGNASVAELHDDLDVRTRESLAKIVGASRRAGALTEQLITFARGGAPQLKVVAPADIIREAVKLAMSGTNLDVELDLAPELWNLEGDASQLHQVVNNLLINARQAMPSGGTIRISGRNTVTSDGERRVTLVFQDSGPGIPADTLDQIFEPYFSTKDTGTGLGLAIVYSVVRRHGGHIKADNPPAGGARFTLDLPACAREATSVPDTDRTEPITASRVLVLDDEKDVREVLASILERNRIAATTVADGQAAVHAHATALDREMPYDVVILDLTIPGGMGGLAAFRTMRERQPDLLGIVASGYSDDPVMADPSAFGFAAALTKPFEQKDVMGTIARVISARGS